MSENNTPAEHARASRPSRCMPARSRTPRPRPGRRRSTRPPRSCSTTSTTPPRCSVSRRSATSIPASATRPAPCSKSASPPSKAAPRRSPSRRATPPSSSSPHLVAAGRRVRRRPPALWRLDQQFNHSFKRFGWNVQWAEAGDIASFERAISDRTKAIFVESLANPSGSMTDLEAIAAIARKARVPLIVDNTLATPYLVRPFDTAPTSSSTRRPSSSAVTATRSAA